MSTMPPTLIPPARIDPLQHEIDYWDRLLAKLIADEHAGDAISDAVSERLESAKVLRFPVGGRPR